jgi:alpha-tubulin suppressor-like RCC1 family protein
MIAVIAALAGGAGTATSAVAGAGAGKGSEPEGSSLQAWGENGSGQLGNEMVLGTESRTPVAVSGITCAVAAAVNRTDSFAVLGDGTVEGWGTDEGIKAGFLGDNGSSFPLSNRPVHIDEQGITTAVGVTADAEDVYVLLADGTIVGWGNDRSGQFGNGPDASDGSSTPVAIATTLSGAKALAASDEGSTLALLSDGEVDSWGAGAGYDTLGREGNGETPARVEIESGKALTGAQAIGEGSNFSLALVGGEVKTWGDLGEASKAVLGAGPSATQGDVPVTVGGNTTPLKDVSAIAAGRNFALALVEGEVKSWGQGESGQLGDVKEEEANLPVAVANLRNIVAIAATEEDGYALDSSGRVWAWGNNKHGELGTGSSQSTVDEPVEIADLPSGNTGLGGGVDAGHEIALGALSPGGCGSGATTNKTEPTASTPTPTPTQTSTTPTQTTTSTSTSISPASAADHLVLGCSGRKLTLTDVVQRNRRVLLDGAAVSSLAGHEVKILFDGNHQVATATIDPSGLFSASAPLPPPRLRGSNSTRYLAESGSLKSLDLKLTRRVVLDPPTSSAGKVMLAGQVAPPLAKPTAPIVVQQQVTCSATKTIARIKPIADGRFALTIAAPPNAEAAIYRLATKVRGNAKSSKLFPTDSLPEPVPLTP